MFYLGDEGAHCTLQNWTMTERTMWDWKMTDWRLADWTLELVPERCSDTRLRSSSHEVILVHLEPNCVSVI